jgi:hypothetical protein
VVLEESTLRTTYAVSGHAVGHLSFEVPGENALIDTFVSVRNDEEAEQGSLNSTLRWSTSSSWTNNGDIYFFGDLTALTIDTAEQETNSYLGANFSADDTYWATQNYTEYKVLGCAGERISVDLCDERATCDGDTYMIMEYNWWRKYDDNTCGLCSLISLEVPNTATECRNYTFKLGCASDTACSGTPLIRTTVLTNSFKSWITRETLTYGDNQYRASTYLFDGDSEYLSAFGSGQYLVDNAYKW